MSLYQRLKAIFSRRDPSFVVLMYHRVATPVIDPWELAVSPQNFEQQLGVLRDTGLVVPVEALVHQVTSGNAIKPGIVITFDDGYADNYLHAKPLLEKYRLPATFFISTKHIGTEKEFWWDELAHLLLQTQVLPHELSININDIPFYFALKEETRLSDDKCRKYQSWSAYTAPAGPRAELYLKLWKNLFPMAYPEQQMLLQQIKAWAGVEEIYQPAELSMTREQLLELSAGNLFTIGAHTVSHPALAFRSEAEQVLELQENKKYLEQNLGLKVSSVAYPYGNFNAATANVVQQLDFEVAFTTAHAAVQQKNDPFQIGRFQVNNWNGRRFRKFLDMVN